MFDFKENNYVHFMWDNKDDISEVELIIETPSEGSKVNHTTNDNHEIIIKDGDILHLKNISR